MELLTVNNFNKTLHFRCLTGLWIRLWFLSFLECFVSALYSCLENANEKIKTPSWISLFLTKYESLEHYQKRCFLKKWHCNQQLITTKKEKLISVDHIPRNYWSYSKNLYLSWIALCVSLWVFLLIFFSWKRFSLNLMSFYFVDKVTFNEFPLEAATRVFC